MGFFHQKGPETNTKSAGGCPVHKRGTLKKELMARYGKAQTWRRFPRPFPRFLRKEPPFVFSRGTAKGSSPNIEHLPMVWADSRWPCSARRMNHAHLEKTLLERRPCTSNGSVVPKAKLDMLTWRTLLEKAAVHVQWLWCQRPECPSARVLPDVRGKSYQHMGANLPGGPEVSGTARSEPFLSFTKLLWSVFV